MDVRSPFLKRVQRAVLERDSGPLEAVAPAKRSRNVPVVFSAEEAGAVLDGMKGPNALVARLLYGAGLRASSKRFGCA